MSSQGTVRQGLSIRAKVLTLFVSILVTSMFILAIIAVSGTSSIGAQTTDTTVETLREEQEAELSRIAVDRAARSEALLGSWSADAGQLQAIAQDIYSNPSAYGNPAYPAHSYSSNLVAGLPDYGYESTLWGAWADWDHRIQGTPYLNASIVSAVKSDPVYAAEVSNELNMSMLLDPALKSIYNKNAPDATLTWMVREGGFSNSYSDEPIDWYDELQSGLPADWNEPDEEYFQVAAPANNPGRLVITMVPYYDTLVESFITSFVAPVYDGNDFLGVVGLDVSLAAMNSVVTDVQVLDSGYAFLINADGELLAHPALESAITSRVEAGDEEPAVPASELEDGGSDFAALVNSMRVGEAGITEVSYSSGQEMVVSYAPVGTSGFSVAVVVPIDEVEAPVVEIQDNISSTVVGASVAVILVDVVMLAIVVALGIWLVNLIVRPIRQLTEAARSISEGNLDIRFDEGATAEIRKLAQSMEKVLVTLRMGNIAYYGGDLRKAEENYEQGLQLFETTGNLKGQAMCLNNLGNLKRLNGDFDAALELYDEALALDERSGDKRGKANRLSNKGLIYKGQGDLKKALKFYNEALEIDEDEGDRDGIATRLNNIALIYELTDQVDRAEEALERAVDLDRQIGDGRGLAKHLNNYAMLTAEHGNYEVALDMLEEVMDLNKQLEDPKGMAMVYSNMAHIFSNLGDEARAEQAWAEAAKIDPEQSKSVIFVLDTSGSMRGERIKAARGGAKKLYQEHVRPGDQVALIAFRSSVKVQVSLRSAQDYQKKFFKKVDSLDTAGRTAFYDALGKALDLFKKKGKGQLWVVALTDGQDNSSVDFNLKKISNYPQKLGLRAKMIIIGVGQDLDADELRTITKRPEYYIDVTASEGEIGLGIEEAYNTVGALFQDEEVVEGFVPE